MAAFHFGIVIICCLLSQGQGHDDLSRLIKEVSQASNTFGVNLYRTKTIGSSGKRANIFLSPLSIFTALAMVNAGARGETAYQLQKALNWNLISHPGEKIDPDGKMGKFLQAAMQSSAANPVKLANKLWLQKYFCTSACKSYAKKLVRDYRTELGEVQFSLSPENARQDINKWVASKTNGKIKELMKSGSVNSLTRLVLTNAIYFKSNWKFKFDEAYTFTDNFYVSKGNTVKADFMTLTSKMMYIQDDDNMVLEIPYSAHNLSMVIILPRERYGIGKLEKTFTDSLVRKYLKNMKKEKVNLLLPKFKLDSDIVLKDLLSLMGVLDLFDPNSADLSGITGYKGLFVSHAIHKAYIEVNERGSEAAAATGIGASFRSIDPDLYLFYADRPFIFTIIHRPTVTMLFTGEMVNPTVQKTSSDFK